ncbi:MAG: hypothetical protein L7W94_07630, partial [Alphaproteobacteria bacterium]|nr:hypothetical protein [Alphaproteobacteria bacterium]
YARCRRHPVVHTSAEGEGVEGSNPAAPTIHFIHGLKAFPAPVVSRVSRLLLYALCACGLGPLRQPVGQALHQLCDEAKT